MIKAAIIGASGYSGEELIRILSSHPSCEISVITSRQYAGKTVDTVFPRFSGMDLEFSAPDSEQIPTGLYRLSVNSEPEVQFVLFIKELEHFRDENLMIYEAVLN